MPPNRQRRTQILDVAIDILADIGIGAVTHRQVDTRAGLPAGSLLYSDTGRPVGRVAPASVGRDGQKQERPLRSHPTAQRARRCPGVVAAAQSRSAACCDHYSIS